VSYLNIENIKSKKRDDYMPEYIATSYLLFASVGYIILTLAIVVFIKKKFDRIKKFILPTRSVKIVQKLLNVGLKKLPLKESSIQIINALKEYYIMDYCTVFICQDKVGINSHKIFLEIAATDASKLYLSEILDYFNQVMNNMNSFDAKIFINKDRNAFLSYPSAKNRGIKLAYFIPLEIEGKIIGAILMENKLNNTSASLEIEFFKIITENISLILENLIYSDELNELVMKDALTNVYNKRYMRKFITSQIDHDKNFALAILDIDHFKKFNDTYGHQFGDIVLKEVALFIKQSMRGSDEIFRYGGEEFILFFSGTTAECVYKKIDEIRCKLSKLTIINDSGVSVSVTASFGVAEFRKDAENLDDLIDKADKALYRSKETGRNRVTIYTKDKTSTSDRTCKEKKDEEKPLVNV